MGYQIFQVFEGVILVLLLSFLPYEILKNGIKINMYNISYYVFNVFFILPELVTLCLGTVDLEYRGFQLILRDIWIDIIWLFIIIVIDSTLLIWVKRRGRRNLAERSVRLDDLKKQIKIPGIVKFISYFLVLLPTIAALLAPQPSLYFSAFAAFYRQNVYYVTSEAIAWNSNVMGNVLNIAAVGLIALWIDSQKKRGPFRFVLWLIAFEILWFSNKRTLGLLIIILLLIIDIFYGKKIPWLKIVTVVTGCVAYFVVYQNVAKAHNISIDNSFVNIYHLYFDRVIDMKLVIGSLLYPDRIQILDYWGQSYLFNVLFFVPRSLWANKPYPFAMYYSAAVKLGTLANVNGRFLTSFFAEAIANFSWFGLPVGLFLYRKIIDFVERLKNPFVYLFGVYTCIYLMITQFGSNHTNLVLLVFLYIVLEKRTRRKQRKAKDKIILKKGQD